MVDIRLYLDEPSEQWLSDLVGAFEQVEGHGFMGFDTRERMESYLRSSVFGEESVGWTAVDPEEVRAVVEEAAARVADVIGDDFLVYVLPCAGSFVHERMGGVSGFSVWRDTVVLLVSGVDGWRERLADAYLHEATHAYRLRYHPRECVLDDVVFEGLAEHFKEVFGTGEHSPWVSGDGEAAFAKIADVLDATSEQVRMQAQFEGWAAYKAGYWLVGRQELSWPDALEWPNEEFE